MQILGIRTSPTTVRYAILNWDGTTASLLNSNGENKLDFPVGCQKIQEKLHWLNQELERVLRQYTGIEKIVIKINEFFGKEKMASREAAYFDAVILMVAGKRRLSADRKLYRAIGTRRNEVKIFAQKHVGCTTRYWNEQMADAIAAAWSGKAN